MKEWLSQRIQTIKAPEGARQFVREYLQALVLQSMQGAGAMAALAFHGGTCLRLLYGIPRWSEDLDFALEGDPDRYDLAALVGSIRRDLQAQAYEVEVSLAAKRAAQHGLVKLPGLLHELGLSPQPSQVVSIKVEVDTRPPHGAACETTLVRRNVTLRLWHHDRASLLAGKVHAVLERRHAKGRDLYDLLWYLSDPGWPAPNLVMLRSALEQSGWKGPEVTERTWREQLAARCATLDWGGIRADVAPFLERQEDLQLLEVEHVLRLLRV